MPTVSSRNLAIHLTVDHLAQLDAGASSVGNTRSAWVRYLLVGEPLTRKVVLQAERDVLTVLQTMSVRLAAIHGVALRCGSPARDRLVMSELATSIVNIDAWLSTPIAKMERRPIEVVEGRREKIAVAFKESDYRLMMDAAKRVGCSLQDWCESVLKSVPVVPESRVDRSLSVAVGNASVVLDHASELARMTKVIDTQIMTLVGDADGLMRPYRKSEE